MEQHEYLERSRAYAKRIETVGIKVPEVSYCLLRDIPAPERILASEPITQTDKEMVSFKYCDVIYFWTIKLKKKNYSNLKQKCLNFTFFLYMSKSIIIVPLKNSKQIKPTLNLFRFYFYVFDNFEQISIELLKLSTLLHSSVQKIKN